MKGRALDASARDHLEQRLRIVRGDDETIPCREIAVAYVDVSVRDLLKHASRRARLVFPVNGEKIGKLISDGVIEGGMIPKVESAMAAIRKGVAKVHMIDGRVAHALLLEVFTNDGIGTEITA